MPHAGHPQKANGGATSDGPPLAPVSAEGRRLLAIDGLRGVAVLAVVLHHLALTVIPPPTVTVDHAFPAWYIAGSAYGRMGVHLFLVISGFCIHMGWARRGDRRESPRFFSFWKRRMHRLYPPYFFVLVGTLAWLFCFHRFTDGAPRLGYASSFDLYRDVVLHLVLLQNVAAVSLRIGNGPLWTLALEEQLYLMYFAMIFLRRRYGWRTTLVVIALFTLAWRATGLFIFRDAAMPTFWFAGAPARWLEWVLGALAVEAYVGVITLPWWCSSVWSAVALGVAAVLINLPSVAALPYVAVVTDVLPGLCFFVTVNLACRRRWRGLSAVAMGWVGVMSYSLYLTHEPTITIVKLLGQPAGMGVLPLSLLRFVVALAVGLLFFRWVERRFLSRARARP